MFVSRKNGQLIADELSAVLNKDINIIDKNGIIISSTDRSRIGMLHEGAKRLIENNMDALTLYADDKQAGTKAGVNLPISIEGEVVGVIGVTGRPEDILTPAGVIKKMTELMIINLRRQEEKLAAENRRRLFCEYWLMAERPRAEELTARAKAEGISLELPRAAAVFSGDSVELCRSIARRIEGDRQSVCLDFRENAVLILAAQDRGLLAAQGESITAEMREKHGQIFCGVSLAEGKSMAAAYREAREALRMAERSGVACVVYDETNPDYIVKCIPDSLREKLAERMKKDCTEEEWGEVRRTVNLFFEHGGDIGKMAESAFVHKNTIYYRLKQVKKLTGRSLTEPKEAFLLYIACME